MRHVRRRSRSPARRTIRRTLQFIGRSGVDDAAACDHNGAAGSTQQLDQIHYADVVRGLAFYALGALLKQLQREVVRLGLNILRQGDGHGAGLDLIRENAHGVWQGGQKLLRAGDTIE